MTKTIELPEYYASDRKNARYGTLEELKELLLYKRIVKWDKEFLLLEDGTKVTLNARLMTGMVAFIIAWVL